MNNYVCIGRLTNNVEVKELEDGKKVSNITVAVSRSYKNEEGIYETDFVDCTLWGNIASNVAEYCKKGDVIGVKGRLETSVYEKEDGSKQKRMNVIAEKITFLSSSKEHKDDIEV